MKQSTTSGWRRTTKLQEGNFNANQSQTLELTIKSGVLSWPLTLTIPMSPGAVLSWKPAVIKVPKVHTPL